MKPTQPTVTTPRWGFSTTSSSDTTGCQISVYRFVGRKLATADLNGLTVASDDQARAIALARGYLQPYCRNSCKFVMSRAARRHGVTTQDWLYNSRRKRLAK